MATNTSLNYNLSASNHSDFQAVILNSAELFQLSELCQSENARLYFVSPLNDEHAKRLSELRDFYNDLAIRFHKTLTTLQNNNDK